MTINHYIVLILLFLSSVSTAQDATAINALKEQATNKNVAEAERLSALNQLSAIYYYKDLKKSKKYISDALALAQKDSSSPEMCTVYNNQALLNIGLGQYESAIAQSMAAIQIAKQLNRPVLLATSYAQLSFIYSIKGYAHQAIFYNIEAIELAEKLENKQSMAIGYYYIGKSYYNLDELDKAALYFEKSKAFFETDIDNSWMAFLYVELGLIYIEKEEWKLAEEYILKAMELSKKQSNARGEAYAHYVLAKWNEQQELSEEASSYLNKAIVYYNKLEDEIGVATALQLLGKISIKRGQYKEADAHLNKALQIAKTARAMVLTKAIYEGLTELYATSGNFQLAFDYNRKYHVVKDSIFNIDRNREVTEIETKHNTQVLAKEKAELTKKTNNQALEIDLRNERLRTQQLKNTQNSYIIIGLIAGLVLMMIIGLLIFRQDKLKTQIRETELEQRALRSQMNPHFMFNSLNSVQSLIATGNNSEASIYLAKFSRLMRRILQNSRQAYIPLRQEIEFLDNYIELEQRRFKEAFDYELDEEDIEDANFVMIPPLVIQPFIENAIIHGLLRKSEKGTLLLKFEDYNNTFIKCTITDNGIGRKAAATFKTDESQESLGIKITEQRLHYLTIKQKITEPFVKVIDLTDEQGNAVGTRIELLLPIKYKTTN